MKNYFKIIYTLALLISFTWQSVAKTIIYFSFKQNQKTLAVTVCENKDKPKSCCQAKCYLDKEIKKEDSRQANLPAGLKDKVEKTELNYDLLNFIFINTSYQQNNMFSYSEFILTTFSKSVFQPPR